MDSNPPGQDALTLYVSLLHHNARMPTKSHVTDAGWDLYACQDIDVFPGDYANIPTGVAVGIPEGWYGHILGRSSTSHKHGLEVVPAVIDQGYRGELFYQLHNPRTKSLHQERNSMDDWSYGEYYIRAGMRLAQLIILPVPVAHWVSVAELPTSDRGTRGFGDSGL